MRKCFLITIVLIIAPLHISAEGFYKWTDARGTVHYGEKAPKNSRANIVDMPAMTILSDYGKQWQPLEPLSAKKIASSVVTNVTQQSTPKKIAVAIKPSYLSLKFIAPKANQAIKAKDGDVSAMLSIKPPLKKGHKIVFIIDNKPANKSKSRISNFSNLSAGSHSLSANIVNKTGDTVMSTQELSFIIKR